MQLRKLNVNIVSSSFIGQVHNLNYVLQFCNSYSNKWNLTVFQSKHISYLIKSVVKFTLLYGRFIKELECKKIAVMYLLTKSIEVFPREYQIRLQ